MSARSLRKVRAWNSDLSFDMMMMGERQRSFELRAHLRDTEIATREQKIQAQPRTPWLKKEIDWTYDTFSADRSEVRR